MKFLVDAQLPKVLALFLNQRGIDAIHTLDLKDGNRSSDTDIADIANNHERVVITKDDDFIQSHLLTDKPKKLLIIATGNIKNSDLLEIFQKSLEAILKSFEESDFIELHRDKLVIH